MNLLASEFAARVQRDVRAYGVSDDDALFPISRFRQPSRDVLAHVFLLFVQREPLLAIRSVLHRVSQIPHHLDARRRRRLAERQGKGFVKRRHARISRDDEHPSLLPSLLSRAHANHLVLAPRERGPARRPRSARRGGARDCHRLSCAFDVKGIARRGRGASDARAGGMRSHRRRRSREGGRHRARPSAARRVNVMRVDD